MRPLSVSQRETVEEATAMYQAALTPEAEAYLAGRGLSAEVIRTFRLGSVVDPAPGHRGHAGKLAIPYLSSDGHPVAIRFRCIQPHDCSEFNHGKYATVGGETSRLFNVGALNRANDDIHITEGEFDAMVLEQCGLPAVAVPGVHNWKSHHPRLLTGFNRVWIWGDPDDAGSDMIREISRRLFQAKPVHLREGDITDTYLKSGCDDESLLSLVREKK